MPLALVLFRAYGLYAIDLKRIGHGALDDAPGLFHSLLLFTVGLWLLLSWLDPGQQAVAWNEMLLYGCASFVLVFALRRITRTVVNRMFGPQRTLLVGSDPVLLTTLLRKLRTHPEYNLFPVGLLASPDDPGTDLGLPVLGTADHLVVEDVVGQHQIEHVIVSPEIADESVFLLLERCRHLDLKVSLLPSHMDAMGPSVTFGEIEGITVLNLNPLVLSRSSRALKRSLDLIVAALAVLILAPVLLLVAAVIRLDSKGPAIFRQCRIGQNGRRFQVFKFRTMVRDAEQLRDDLLKDSKDADWLHLQVDPRVTRVGRVLRKLSVDELPQLFNVVRGDMSLVGPRPLIPEESSRVVGRDSIRLDLRPGITGLWQVLGRTDISFSEMLKLDYVYVTNWSLWGDVKLLLRTLPAVVSGRGVN